MKKPSLLGIGLAIIALVVALVVLADMFKFLKANDIFGIYWPAVLVLVGIFSFSASGAGNSVAFGFVILGIMLTLRNLGVFNTQAGEMIFIVLICLAALAVLVISTSKKPDKN